MAIDDDPLEIQLQHSKQELDRKILPTLIEAAVAIVLSTFPFSIGAGIQSLFDGQARRNVERRWIELFEDMRERIEQIRSHIPDEHYYGSEEFQTLLALASEQLLTTHDRAKRRMLAAALANSGNIDFAEDDKELLVRLMRDISIADVLALEDERLQSSYRSDCPNTYSADEIADCPLLASRRHRTGGSTDYERLGW